MRAFALLFLCLAAFAWPAAAQDIPGRVGRLAWVDGGVALYQDPDRGWEDAYLNSPITSENSVWTEPDARAEVQVAAIALRMDGESQLDVSRIDDRAIEATLARGSLAVRIHHLQRADLVRLSTPQASFLLQAAGRYRLDADPQRGESRLSVFEGYARLETAGARVPIRAGESIVVWGEDRPEYAVQEAYLTDFDRWAMARDERWGERRAPEYVSYEMTGYEDLDAYGEWSQDPVYGAVWFPTRVEPDWAPYRDGRWTYLRPWGWTWVDAQPWGYAPFHYGRWVHVRDRWAWSPGRRVDRPVWAPALVGFIGGSGWSVGASTGAVVGWYPLAPSEPYRPWYRASRQYEQRLNVAVVKVPERVAREHREWNRDRAATVVRRQALVEQRPVAQARVAVPPQALRTAPAMTAPATALPKPGEMREAHRREQAQGGTHAGPPAPSPIARPGAAPHAEAANPAARPSFAKPHVAPHAAPKGSAPPPPPNARPAAPQAQERRPQNGARIDQGPRANNPAQERGTREREAEHNRANAARATEEQRSKDANAAREAEQNRAKAQREAEQNRAKAAREAEQNRAKEQREAGQNRANAAHEAEQNRMKAREAEQNRANAAREAEQNRAKAQREAEQNRAKAARETEQNRAKAAREAEQNRAKAREAEQNRAKEQQAAARDAQRKAEQARNNAAKEAQQHAAQQAQQRAAHEAQLRGAQEAKQKAAHEAQLRAAQEAKQKAAHEAQLRAAQEAKQKAGPQSGAPEAQQQHAAPQAQEKGRGAAHREPPPQEHGKDGKEKGRGEGG